MSPLGLLHRTVEREVPDRDFPSPSPSRSPAFCLPLPPIRGGITMPSSPLQHAPPVLWSTFYRYLPHVILLVLVPCLLSPACGQLLWQADSTSGSVTTAALYYSGYWQHVRLSSSPAFNAIRTVCATQRAATPVPVPHGSPLSPSPPPLEARMDQWYYGFEFCD